MTIAQRLSGRAGILWSGGTVPHLERVGVALFAAAILIHATTSILLRLNLLAFSYDGLFRPAWWAFSAASGGARIALLAGAGIIAVSALAPGARVSHGPRAAQAFGIGSLVFALLAAAGIVLGAAGQALLAGPQVAGSTAGGIALLLAWASLICRLGFRYGRASGLLICLAAGGALVHALHLLIATWTARYFLDLRWAEWYFARGPAGLLDTLAWVLMLAGLWSWARHMPPSDAVRLRRAGRPT